MEWIKWWKDKTFLTILAVSLVTMGAAFLWAYLFEWGWIPAVVTALLGARVIRRAIIKRIEENL